MIDTARFAADGYVILDGLVDAASLATFERTMQDLAVRGLARKGLEPRSPDAIADLLRTGGDYRTLLFTNLKHLRIVQAMGQQVVDRVEREGFFDWADLAVPVAYPSIKADVPGEDKYLLPMHQDYATPCRKAWRVWVTLRDADVETGTLRIVPGTHTLGFVAHDTSDPARPAVPEALYAGPPAVTLRLPAGSGILFDPLLIHGSVGARRDRMKYNLLVNLWDLATLADPDDPDDPLPARLEMRRVRDRVRG